MNAVLRLSLDWEKHGKEMASRGWKATGPGDFVRRRRPEKKFINVFVSDNPELTDQVTEAISFLESNEEYLSGLVKESGGAELDFGISCSECPSIWLSNRRYRPELLAVLARLGITLNTSIYWAMNVEEDDEKK